RSDLTRLLQLCESLQGHDESHPPWALQGRHFDLTTALAQEGVTDRSNLVSLHGFVSMLRYWFGDLASAVEAVDKVEKDAAALAGTSNEPELWLFDGLVRFAQATVS